MEGGTLMVGGVRGTPFVGFGDTDPMGGDTGVWGEGPLAGGC